MSEQKQGLAAVFKTEEEQRLARQLGFKVPGAAKPQGPALPKEDKTNVVGYFNPNPWPLHIGLGELGLSVELQQKGDYVMMEVGGKRVKVNDPVLDDYVKPLGLAREVAREKRVPIVFFPRPKAREGSSHGAVFEATEFVKGPDGRTQAIIKPLASMVTATNPAGIQLPGPGATGNPVLGMSRDMAEQLRLIKPTRQVPDSGMTETGKPVDGKDLPQIEYADDMGPRQTAEYRRLKAASMTQSKMDVATPPTPMAQVPVAPSIPLEEIAETPEQLAQLREMMKSGDLDLTNLTDVNAILQAPQAVPTVDVAPELPEPDLPEPQLESTESGQAPDSGLRQDSMVSGGKPEAATESATAEPTTSNQSALRFRCPLCADVGYPFRSGLDRHVRTKHGDQFDAIMSRFPVSKRR